jgi:5'-nucleotidase
MEARCRACPRSRSAQYYGPANASSRTVRGGGRPRRGCGAQALDQGHWDRADYRVFYNVNFPPVPAADVRARASRAQGFRRGTGFGVKPHTAPNGRRFLWITGGPQHVPTEPGTDAHANLEGYVSVTPMRADLTAHDRSTG